jgi:hypothetical protein
LAIIVVIATVFVIVTTIRVVAVVVVRAPVCAVVVVSVIIVVAIISVVVIVMPIRILVVIRAGRVVVAMVAATAPALHVLIVGAVFVNLDLHNGRLSIWFIAILYEFLVIISKAIFELFVELS